MITYDWPAGGADPFEPTGPEPTWVLMDGLHHWGRAWPAGDRRDFGSWEGFEKRVPMGYKVIEIRERIALVRDGAILQPSQQSREATWDRPWGDDHRRLPPYGAAPRTRGGDDRVASCASAEDALTAALRMSAAERGETWLVSRRIAILNWH